MTAATETAATGITGKGSGTVLEGVSVGEGDSKRDTHSGNLTAILSLSTGEISG
jgi:hypothetical protein